MRVELIKGKLMSKQSRKNRESIRDVTAELQIKFIWSTLGAFILSIHPDHKYIWLRGGDFNH